MRYKDGLANAARRPSRLGLPIAAVRVAAHPHIMADARMQCLTSRGHKHISVLVKAVSLNSSFRTAGGASDAKGIAHTHGSLPRESSGLHQGPRSAQVHRLGPGAILPDRKATSLVCAFGLRPTLVAATKAAAAAFRRLGLAGASAASPFMPFSCSSAGAWSLQEERLICEPSFKKAAVPESIRSNEMLQMPVLGNFCFLFVVNRNVDWHLCGGSGAMIFERFSASPA